MNVALAARAGFEIVFEIAVLRGSMAKLFDYRWGERCAAQVGVENDASRVDDRQKRARENSFNFGGDKFFHGGGGEAYRREVCFTGDPRAKIGEHGASDFDDQVAVHALGECSEVRLKEQFVDRRNLTQKFGLLGGDRSFASGFHVAISA